VSPEGHAQEVKAALALAQARVADQRP
jgi:hypothetical protein